MNKWRTEEFLYSEIVHVISGWWMPITVYLLRLTEGLTSRVNLTVNYGL